YVGAIHCWLASQTEPVQLIDISHNISPQNIWQGALAVRRYCHQYPKNTVHVAVVDPGVGSGRAAIALKCQDHWLIGPNNGLLSLAAKTYQDAEVYHLKSHTEWWQKHNSFDGLSLFIPAAYQISQGTPISELAESSSDFHQLTMPIPEIVTNQLIGQIIAFDHFGNAITNISRADAPQNQGTVFMVANNAFPLVNCYSDADASSRCAIVNSDGLIELCVYQSSASRSLGLSIGDSVATAIKS
ncbi:MAG: SAM-dependent chlorinase/fluorinase, partial [Kangiellaceae bacterium]|nr:SAM-dependent chlorinase/fluorinase [Kangiellaceae bacterium]